MSTKWVTSLAAVAAVGLALGAPSEAGARTRRPGCCGALKPSYTHRDVYPRAHIVERRVTRLRTTRFPQYHPVIHVTRVHPTTVVHTTLVEIHRRVGYKVDVHAHRSQVMPTRVVHVTTVVHRSVCVCVKGSTHCR